jgi:DNA ligase-1
MRKILDLIPLHSIEKNGKTRVWYASIHYHPSSNTAYSVIEFGQEGGKLQTSTREYTTGKNIGRKNETTPLEQCTNETQRKWLDKKEKEGYFEVDLSTDDADVTEIDNATGVSNVADNTVGGSASVAVARGPYYPMLAHTYEPAKSKIVYPCHVQPKLDGLRCIVYTNADGIVFQSRTAGHFDTMEHLVPYLTAIFRHDPSVIFDGELYTTELPFEELAGLIKKRKITDDDKVRLQQVHYHIYDIINDEPFCSRYERLQKILNAPYRYIHLVPTHVAASVQDFRERFRECIEQGMEGIMLRNSNGIYRQHYRSNDLQKYKEFMEEEYEIIGFKEGDGRDKGCVIWECQTPEKRQFWVRPRGSLDMRKEQFMNGQQYVGSLLTVTYQEKSEHDVPRFPVGKSIRDGY